MWLHDHGPAEAGHYVLSTREVDFVVKADRSDAAGARNRHGSGAAKAAPYLFTGPDLFSAPHLSTVSVSGGTGLQPCPQRG